jgi:dienelactone hydrolase
MTWLQRFMTGYGLVMAVSAVSAVSAVGAQAPLPADVRTVEVRLPSAEKGVELTAFWTPPQVSGTTGSPAVIALHGCDGLPSDRARLAYPRNRYVKLLNDSGAGVLYVDSFGSRGEGNLCAQKPALRDITEANRRLDVVGALQWLAHQPGIDSGKLGVVGWSHGGQTVLAVADANADPMRQALVKPAALVAFYAGCSAYEKASRYEVVTPLLVMSGELDNWTPAAPCQRLTQRLQASGQPVRYVQYEGSYHAFDSASPVTERNNAAGTKTGRAMAGGNPAARAASAREMMQFLGLHLGLRPATGSAEQPFQKAGE